MKIVDTTHIEGFPSDVVIGSASISEDFTARILSTKEKEEFRHFKNPGRQAEYLTARHLFQFMTGEVMGTQKQAHLDKEPGGKPFARIGDKHLYVSFSHSQKKVFCAVSEFKDIGIDTELLHRAIPNRVLKRVLDKTEMQLLEDLDPLQIWTLKEAAVKCLGTGLRTNLNEVRITLSKDNEISARFNNDKFIEICSFRTTDHQIALAYHSKHI